MRRRLWRLRVHALRYSGSVFAVLSTGACLALAYSGQEVHLNAPVHLRLQHQPSIVAICLNVLDEEVRIPGT